MALRGVARQGRGRTLVFELVMNSTQVFKCASLPDFVLTTSRICSAARLQSASSEKKSEDSIFVAFSEELDCSRAGSALIATDPGLHESPERVTDNPGPQRFDHKLINIT